MFSIKEFSENLDLTDFYKNAEAKGYYNNCNQEVLIDNMRHFNDYKVWLLYWKDKCVGSVGVHSLEELGILGKNAYRIAVRTCLLQDQLEGERSHRVHNYRHKPMNHAASQMLIPMCIKYCGYNTPMYVSTNNSKDGIQYKVNRTWASIMHNQNYLEDAVELDYRNQFQNFWKLRPHYYVEKLREHIWPEAEFILEGL